MWPNSECSISLLYFLCIFRMVMTKNLIRILPILPLFFPSGSTCYGRFSKSVERNLSWGVSFRKRRTGRWELQQPPRKVSTRGLLCLPLCCYIDQGRRVDGLLWPVQLHHYHSYACKKKQDGVSNRPAEAKDPSIWSGGGVIYLRGPQTHKEFGPNR